MGLITYTTPDVEVTLVEYDGNHTTMYDEFNGNIDNANIKTAAGIVDTKLATISTAGKVLETALPTTYAVARTYNAGLTVANSGGTGISVSDGITVVTGGATISAGGITVTLGGIDIDAGGMTVAGGVTVEDTGLTVTAGGATITDGGLTVTAGGLTVTAGGVTITAGDLDVVNGAVNITGVAGIDYNIGGTDTDVDIATVTVAGTPTISWGETANRFQMSKGLDITSGSLTVNNDLTIQNDIIVTAGDLTVTAGNIILSGGSATVDGVDISAHDTAVTGVHGSAVTSFSVQKTGDQVINTSNEQIVWDTENLDSAGDFASNKFTPQVAGTYFMICSCTIDLVSTGAFTLTLRKNSVAIESSVVTHSVSLNDTHVTVHALNIANGSTDDYEIVATSSTTDAIVKSGITSTFQGFRLPLS